MNKSTFLKVGSTIALISCALISSSVIAVEDVPQTKDIEGKEYKLTFSSEFSGDKLDETQWIPRFDDAKKEIASTRSGGIVWSPETTWLDGKGNLVMAVYTKNLSELEPEQAKVYEGKDIRWLPFSRMLRTKESFKYGYYEVRLKMPITKGIGIAVWMQSPGMTDKKSPSIDGSGGTEIDLIEQTFFDRNGSPTDYKHTTVHWGGYGDHHQFISIGVEPGDEKKNDANNYDIFGKTKEGMTKEQRTHYSKNLNFRDDKFHTVSMLWTPEFYKFYYDDELIGTITQGVSQAPEHMILWPRLFSFHQHYAKADKGLGDRENTKTKFLFDYFRVYQLEK